MLMLQILTVRTAEDLSEPEDASNIENTNTKRFRTYEPNGQAKRVRTVSPTRAAKAVKQKRYVRGQKRVEEQRKRLRNRAEAKEAALFNDLIGDFPDIQFSSSRGTSYSRPWYRTKRTDER